MNNVPGLDKALHRREVTVDYLGVYCEGKMLMSRGPSTTEVDWDKVSRFLTGMPYKRTLYKAPAPVELDVEAQERLGELIDRIHPKKEKR